uniref:Uncharacterized protein n=1 Tax=Panagrolaimus davidi TaxID=227884 RepID=A0A914PR19_9BILA
MWRINHENREEQSTKEDIIPESLPPSKSSISTDNYLISMNRFFEDNEDLLTKCNRIAQRISEELVQKRITYKSATLSQFKNIVMWLRVRTFNYTTFEIVGSQVKFSPNGPLSIATIYACRDQDDVDLGDGTAIDFQKQ